eukprot:ANDGO_00515.mRNA.1 Calpain-type cysteine protease DEK1
MSSPGQSVGSTISTEDATTIVTYSFTIGVGWLAAFLGTIVFTGHFRFRISRIPVWLATRDWLIFKPPVPRFFYWLAILHPLLWLLCFVAPNLLSFAWAITIIVLTSSKLPGISILCIIPAVTMTVYAFLYWRGQKYRFTDYPKHLLGCSAVFLIAFLILHVILARPFSFQSVEMVFFSLSFVCMVKTVYIHASGNHVSFEKFIHQKAKKRTSTMNKDDDDDESENGFQSLIPDDVLSFVSNKGTITALWYLASAVCHGCFVMITHFVSQEDPSLSGQSSTLTFNSGMIALSLSVIDGCAYVIAAARFVDSPYTLSVFLLFCRLLLVLCGSEYWFWGISILYILISCFLLRGSLFKARWWRSLFLQQSKTERFRRLKKLDLAYRMEQEKLAAMTALQTAEGSGHPIKETKDDDNAVAKLFKQSASIAAEVGKGFVSIMMTSTEILFGIIERYTQPALYVFLSGLYAALMGVIVVRADSNAQEDWSLWGVSAVSTAVISFLVVPVYALSLVLSKFSKFLFRPPAEGSTGDPAGQKKSFLGSGWFLFTFAVASLCTYGIAVSIGLIAWLRDDINFLFWGIISGLPALLLSFIMYELWIQNDCRWFDIPARRRPEWSSSVARVRPLFNIPESAVHFVKSRLKGREETVATDKTSTLGEPLPTVPSNSNSPQNASIPVAFLLGGLTSRDYIVILCTVLHLAFLALFSILLYLHVRPSWLSWTIAPVFFLAFSQFIVLNGWGRTGKFGMWRAASLSFIIVGWVAVFVAFYYNVFGDMKSDADARRSELDSEGFFTIIAPFTRKNVSQYSDITPALLFAGFCLLYPSFLIETMLMKRWHDDLFASSNIMMTLFPFSALAHLSDFSLKKFLQNKNLWFAISTLSTFGCVGGFCWFWGIFMGHSQGFLVFLFFCVCLMGFVLSSQPTWILTNVESDSTTSAHPLPSMMTSRLLGERLAVYVFLVLCLSGFSSLIFILSYRSVLDFPFSEWLIITCTMTTILAILALLVYVRFFFFQSPWADPQRLRFSPTCFLPVYLYDESQDLLYEKNDPFFAVVLAAVLSIVWGLAATIVLSPSTMGISGISLAVALFAFFMIDKTFSAEVAFSSMLTFVTPDLTERMRLRAKRKEFDINAEVEVGSNEFGGAEERIGELEDDAEFAVEAVEDESLGNLDPVSLLLRKVWAAEDEAFSISYGILLKDLWRGGLTLLKSPINLINREKRDDEVQRDQDVEKGEKTMSKGDAILEHRFECLLLIEKLDNEVLDVYQRQNRFVAHFQSLLIAAARYKRKQQLSEWCEFIRMHPAFGTWARSQHPETLAFLLDECLLYASEGEKAQKQLLKKHHRKKTATVHPLTSTRKDPVGFSVLNPSRLLTSLASAITPDMERDEVEIAAEVVVQFQTYVLDKEEDARRDAQKAKQEEEAHRKRVQSLNGGLGFIKMWEKRCAAGVFGFMFVDSETSSEEIEESLHKLVPEARELRLRLEQRWNGTEERKVYETAVREVQQKWISHFLKTKHGQEYASASEDEIHGLMMFDDAFNDAMSFLLLQTQVRLIVQECRSSGQKFTDYDFPASEASLWTPPPRSADDDHDAVADDDDTANHMHAPQFISMVHGWQRASDLGTQEYLFENGVDPSDVCQGMLGDCYFLSALAVTAKDGDGQTSQIPALFIIPEGDDTKVREGTSEIPVNSCGVFGVRLFKEGRWVGVVVDDYLPVQSNGSLAFVRSKTGHEYWCSLLEKAYAKIHGTYQSIDAGKVHDALVDLTGGVGQLISLAKSDAEVQARIASGELWACLVRYVAQGYLLGASSSQGSDAEANEYGIVPGHAYSVLDVQEIVLRDSVAQSANREVMRTDDGGVSQSTVGGASAASADGSRYTVRLVQLRNPWGDTEWTGDWSDHSPLWTESAREQILRNQNFRRQQAISRKIYVYLKKNPDVARSILAESKGSTPGVPHSLKSSQSLSQSMETKPMSVLSPRLVASLSPRILENTDEQKDNEQLSSEQLIAAGTSWMDPSKLLVRSAGEMLLDLDQDVLGQDGANAQIADDGTFWMSFDDFVTHYTGISVCKIFDPSWQRMALHGSWKNGETAGGAGPASRSINPHYGLSVRTPGTFLIVLEQAEGRGAAELSSSGRNPETGFLKIGAYLLRKGGKRIKTMKKADLVSCTSVTDARTVSIEVQLAVSPPDEPYSLMVTTLQPGEEGQYRLLFFGTGDYAVASIPQEVDAV